MKGRVEVDTSAKQETLKTARRPPESGIFRGNVVLPGPELQMSILQKLKKHISMSQSLLLVHKNAEQTNRALSERGLDEMQTHQGGNVGSRQVKGEFQRRHSQGPRL